MNEKNVKHERYIESEYWIGAADDSADGVKIDRRSNSLPGKSGIAPGQFGFANPFEAEAVATREYTARQTEPIHTLLISKVISFQEANRVELLKMLQRDGFRLFTRDYSAPFREGPTADLLDKTVWVGPKGVLSLIGVTGLKKDEGRQFMLVSTDTALQKTYADWWDSCVFDISVGRVSTAKISGVFQGKSGPEIRRFNEPIGYPLEVNNYEPNVLAFYEKVKNELASRTPSGRLVLLDGPPGTGKTFILRGLVHELSKKAEFVYLPAGLVGSLDGPGMIGALERDERLFEEDVGLPKIFIIEDADECLISRGSDNMSPIRNLLNYCDGFLGAMLDIRVVATTNSGHIGRTDKIDKALLRPGRLLAHSTVGALSPTQAEKRLLELTKKEIKVQNPASIAEVYSLARTHGWTPSE